MPDPNPQYLVVGEILKPWGYRGEVKVRIITAFPNRLVKHKIVYLGKEARAFAVERARLHSGFAIFKFAGCDTPEAAAKLRGAVVQIPVEEAAPLRAGQYYYHQIIGLQVFTTEGEPLGTVEQILETGANDVYLVRRPNGTELLLPAIKEVIRAIDLERRAITVFLLPGLLEEPTDD